MTGTNSIIDLSHHNVNPDLVRAKAAGILGVLHKATQGTTFTDGTFATNRQKAASAGLLFGAYHFGVGGDGTAQADFFLNAVQPGPTDLIVLDFEPNTQGPSMTLDQARAFVTRVNAVTGRFPGLYSGSYVKELLGAAHDPVLANCWLWLAQYGPAAKVPASWSTWTIWQYTDGTVGPDPQPVDGIGICDRNTFNGTADELVAFWQAGGIVADPGIAVAAIT